MTNNIRHREFPNSDTLGGTVCLQLNFKTTTALISISGQCTRLYLLDLDLRFLSVTLSTSDVAKVSEYGRKQDLGVSISGN
jgi:hypothetical protein